MGCALAAVLLVGGCGESRHLNTGSAPSTPYGINPALLPNDATAANTFFLHLPTQINGYPLKSVDPGSAQWVGSSGQEIDVITAPFNQVRGGLLTMAYYFGAYPHGNVTDPTSADPTAASGLYYRLGTTTTYRSGVVEPAFEFARPGGTRLFTIYADTAAGRDAAANTFAATEPIAAAAAPIPVTTVPEPSIPPFVGVVPGRPGIGACDRNHPTPQTCPATLPTAPPSAVHSPGVSTAPPTTVAAPATPGL